MQTTVASVAVLAIEPALVRRVSSDMLERHTIVPASPRR